MAAVVSVSLCHVSSRVRRRRRSCFQCTSHTSDGPYYTSLWRMRMGRMTSELLAISGLASVGFAEEAGAVVVAVAPLAVVVGSVVRILRVLPPEPLAEGKGCY